MVKGGGNTGRAGGSCVVANRIPSIIEHYRNKKNAEVKEETKERRGWRGVVVLAAVVVLDAVTCGHVLSAAASKN